jgi:hypothetical protein
MNKLKKPAFARRWAFLIYALISGPKGFEENKNVRPKWPVPERDARESFCEWLGGGGAGRDDERLAEPFRVRHFSHPKNPHKI